MGESSRASYLVLAGNVSERKLNDIARHERDTACIYLFDGNGSLLSPVLSAFGNSEGRKLVIVGDNNASVSDRRVSFVDSTIEYFGDRPTFLSTVRRLNDNITPVEGMSWAFVGPGSTPELITAFRRKRLDPKIDFGLPIFTAEEIVKRYGGCMELTVRGE